MNLNDLIALIEKSAQHSTLYHFTDESNFASIGTYGCFLKLKCERKAGGQMQQGETN
jgi:hypothetical protein